MVDAEMVREARRLATDHVLNEILDGLVARSLDEIKSSQPDEFDKRDEAYRMMRAIEALRTEIKSVASSLDIAEWNRRLRRSQV